ncbi:helix-turn-helix transcriptional regulator [Ehrlichia ruminantium]|uniref:Hypothetical transcriptional regulator n=2 Tax=Ehrlichia ruminantium TaxID=779 RepID=Q6VCZ2_EHRRU|nr:helix-turn-helix transcriptional regulator [Ehrlichia ruminantium]AAR10929.1 hypothetical transcriptional regulator [Ehrlichia ruminantium]KYW93878.1 transcriptional regulator [Ehrlichia ruminantium]QLK50945.1 helix-turn-helix transcriptional regulator [Ehrlichia ruminantium]QLK51867.1 helix-turn-helix transcriptional regulator [Ehrlichia ruminantium]QLK53708.1 helix-turn-helix transcriptional regulator [Ehrlichia ruminantium]
MSIHAKNKTNKLDYANEIKAQSPIFNRSVTEDTQNNFNKNNIESMSGQKSTTPKSRPHPVDECVGKEIKRQRIMRGMSQNQLANKLGITFQQVQKYEKGTNRIVISRLYQLASVLNVEVRDIMLKLQEDLKNISCGNDIVSTPSLKDNEEKFVPEFHDSKIDSKEVLMMVRAYTCIKNEKVRNIIYNLVKALSTDNKTSVS